MGPFWPRVQPFVSSFPNSVKATTAGLALFRRTLFFSVMEQREAIEFENVLNGTMPFESKVVARWQRKMQDKSQQQRVSVFLSSLYHV